MEAPDGAYRVSVPVVTALAGDVDAARFVPRVRWIRAVDAVACVGSLLMRPPDVLMVKLASELME